MDLQPHPASAAAPVRRLTASAAFLADGRLALGWLLEGETSALEIPGPVGRYRPDDAEARQDNLWHHTCFEAFLIWDDSPAYREFNFAPDGRWAAYRFDGFRQGMADLELPAPPGLHWEAGAERLALTAVVPCEPIAPAGVRDARGVRLGMTAVLEPRDGALAFWALAHPAAAPEFHHPDSFVLRPSRSGDRHIPAGA